MTRHRRRLPDPHREVLLWVPVAAVVLPLPLVWAGWSLARAALLGVVLLALLTVAYAVVRVAGARSAPSAAPPGRRPGARHVRPPDR